MASAAKKANSKSRNKGVIHSIVPSDLPRLGVVRGIVYRGGWIRMDVKPNERTLHVGGNGAVSYRVGVRTRRVFKQTSTNKWFRWATIKDEA